VVPLQGQFCQAGGVVSETPIFMVKTDVGGG